MNILEIGTVVVLEGNEEAVIASYAKGWYTGEEGEKFRAKKILKVVGAALTGKMSKTLDKYKSGYELSLCASGRKSLNTGDEVAHLLAGLEALEVIATAEILLGLESGELLERYTKLNNGSKRMNAGNLIRSAHKRGEISVNKIKKAIRH